MRAINKKLVRDLWRLRGHLVAIMLVSMCGAASFVAMREAYEAIRSARDDYYRAYRFADVFATAKRAPQSLLPDLREIDGVAAVQERLSWMVSVAVPGLAEPATARLVSVASDPSTMLNGVHLRSGRVLDPARTDEVLVSEAFAAANGFRPGDRIAIVANGRWQRMYVAGIAISPEFINEAFEFTLLPDPKRFGILWMSRAALEAILDMRGAFNDVSFTLAPGAREHNVIAEIDRILAPYGGTGAYGRADQFSNRFLEDELKQDKVTGSIVPTIFLGVAAFLVNNVLLRLIGLQRAQIGVLKAFGYTNRQLGAHFLALGFAAVAAGCVSGIALGAWLGQGLAGIYRDFFHFPSLVFAVSPPTLAAVALIAVVTTATGALPAVARAVALPPAESMRAAPPLRYRPTLLERAGLSRLVPLGVRMVLRTLERRPLRALLSVLGLAFASALLVVGRYGIDATDEIVRVQFRLAMRDDVALFFTEPRGRAALQAIAREPGVLRAEPFRYIPVRVHAGHRSKRAVLQALERDAGLRRPLDRNEHPVQIPANGLMMSAELARVLDVHPGDAVEVEVLEGRRVTRALVVTGTVDEYVGTQSYLSFETAARLLGEDQTLSGAFLSVDPARQERLYGRFRDMPVVAVLGLREAILQSFLDTIARNTAVMTTTLVAFACVIAAGMVYNGARISLSEHAIELASLRILGFTQAEAGVLLVGEQFVLTTIAIPIGFALGYSLAAGVSYLASGETYRLPLIISAKSYLFAGAVVALAAALSAIAVLIRLRKFDLVEALKTRE